MITAQCPHCGATLTFVNGRENETTLARRFPCLAQPHHARPSPATPCPAPPFRAEPDWTEHNYTRRESKMQKGETE